MAINNSSREKSTSAWNATFNENEQTTSSADAGIEIELVEMRSSARASTYTQQQEPQNLIPDAQSPSPKGLPSETDKTAPHSPSTATEHEITTDPEAKGDSKESIGTVTNTPSEDEDTVDHFSLAFESAWKKIEQKVEKLEEKLLKVAAESERNACNSLIHPEHPELNEVVTALESASSDGDLKSDHSGEKKQPQAAIYTSSAKSSDMPALPSGLSLGPMPQEEKLLDDTAKIAPDNSSVAPADHKATAAPETKGDSKQSIGTKAEDENWDPSKINTSIYPLSRAILYTLNCPDDEDARYRHYVHTVTLMEKFERAAYGDMDAQYDLGEFFEQGTKYIDKDETRALYWYRQAAKRGHARALDKVDISDRDKNLDHPKINTPLSLVYKSMLLIFHYSYIATEKFNRKDFVPFFKFIQRFQLAAHGDMDAQYDLGDSFERGTQYVDKDETRALYWYRQAVENGSVLALYDVGIFYYEGKAGLKQNAESSRRSLTTPSSHTTVRAMSHTAVSVKRLT